MLVKHQCLQTSEANNIKKMKQVVVILAIVAFSGALGELEKSKPFPH